MNEEFNTKTRRSHKRHKEEIRECEIMNSIAIPLRSLCLLCALVVNSEAAPPTLTSLFPAGAQRGTTTEITAAGAIDKSTKLWASGKGVSIGPAKEKGSFAVTVAADAVPGTYWLRAYNGDGASGLRPFLVGTLPEVVEKEPNDEPKQLPILPDSCVVNGKLGKAGDVDCFAISAKKGQTLVASLEANRTLKSPMDAMMQIVSTDGFVLDQNNDFIGLDPQIAYAVPKDGTYFIRVFAFPSTPDTTVRFAGGDAYVYRLTATTGGFVDYTVPLSIGPNVKAVEVRGWNISDELRTISVPKMNSPDPHIALFHPKLANPFRARSERDAIAKSSTHGLAKPGDEVRIPFAGKKGQALSIQVESRSFGLAVDPVIRVLDKDQKELARAEPPKLHSDTALSFSPPADGDYSIAVTDLYGGGGPRHAFLLRVLTLAPDYDLTVASDRFAIPPGKSLDIPVKIARKNGFAKPIEIVAEGLPAGVTFEVKVPPGKADPNSITIALAAGKAGSGGAFRLVGKVKDEPLSMRTAMAPLTEFEEVTADLWFAVMDGPMSPTPPKK